MSQIQNQNNHLAQSKGTNRRVFLYGVGVVAPGAANLEEFLAAVKSAQSLLTPKAGLFDAFLSGAPKFDFSVYKDWLEERHGPKRYPLLKDKSGDLVQFALGALIQAVSAHPNLEKAIKALDPNLRVQIASGLADLPVIQKSAREFDKGLFQWNAFWADAKRNEPLALHLNGKQVQPQCPENPDIYPVDSLERYEALKQWNSYWAAQSPLLKDYLAQLREVENQGVVGEDIEAAKMNLIRSKLKVRKELVEKFGAPVPPWESVSPNLLWNIPNVAASQVSMLLGLHAEAIGVQAACASFGTVVSHALQDIQAGHTDLYILGAVDATPCEELISAFYAGRLAVMGDRPGIPFCDLRGTHISGGACVWILAEEGVMDRLQVPHLGIEILGAGTSSDAEHIITPSKEGPKLCMRRAFAQADISKEQIHMWDMHATGTPGDWNEFQLIEEFVPQNAVITARKGIFGHGMAVSGGWELTAQVLAGQKKKDSFVVPACGIKSKNVNPKILNLHRNLALDEDKSISYTSSQGIICGKLSMGVGGGSSCVIVKIH